MRPEPASMDHARSRLTTSSGFSVARIPPIKIKSVAYKVAVWFVKKKIFRLTLSMVLVALSSWHSSLRSYVSPNLEMTTQRVLVTGEWVVQFSTSYFVSDGTERTWNQDHLKSMRKRLRRNTKTFAWQTFLTSLLLLAALATTRSSFSRMDCGLSCQFIAIIPSMCTSK